MDEAHAVGIYGERGSSLIEAAGIDANECLSVNPAGKALGVAGAFVAGPAWAIDHLVQRGRPFIFSTAAPPALADALLVSLDIVEREPERRRRLLALSGFLRSRLAESSADLPDGRSQIVPVMLGGNSGGSCGRRTGRRFRARHSTAQRSDVRRLQLSVNAGLDATGVD